MVHKSDCVAVAVPVALGGRATMLVDQQSLLSCKLYQILGKCAKRLPSLSSLHMEEDAGRVPWFLYTVSSLPQTEFDRVSISAVKSVLNRLK